MQKLNKEHPPPKFGDEFELRKGLLDERHDALEQKMREVQQKASSRMRCCAGSVKSHDPENSELTERLKKEIEIIDEQLDVLDEEELDDEEYDKVMDAEHDFQKAIALRTGQKEGEDRFENLRVPDPSQVSKPSAIKFGGEACVRSCREFHGSRISAPPLTPLRARPGPGSIKIASTSCGTRSRISNGDRSCGPSTR